MSQIQGKWIEPGAITPSLLDATALYTVGSLSVTGDSTIGGGLRVDGTISAPAISTDVVVYNSLRIEDNEDEIALYVQQKDATATKPVAYMDNTGSGPTMVLMPGSSGNILGIGIVPSAPLDVNGQAIFRGDATVSGGFRVDGTVSAGAISSEVIVYDQIMISQSDDQEALIVHQTNGAASAINTRIINEGTGPALTIEGVTPTVAIGASVVTGGQTLDVNGKTRITDTLTCVKDATVSGGVDTNQLTSGVLTVTAGAGVGTDLSVGRDLQVTRDATVSGFALVTGSAGVNGPLFYAFQDATVGATLNAGSKIVTADGSFSRNVGIANRLGVMDDHGPGAMNPESKLHVRTSTGYGGAIGPHSDTQVLIDRDGNAGIQILTPAANSGVVYFGDPSGNQQGRIIYSNSSDSMSLYAGGVLQSWMQKSTTSSRPVVAIGLNDPETYSNATFNELVVGDNNVENHGITIVTGATNTGALVFSNGSSPADVVRGRIQYSHLTNSFAFFSDATQRAILRASPAGAATAQLGVGTASPGAAVHGYTDNTSYAIAVLGETNVAGSTAVRGVLADASTGNAFEGYRGATRVFRVDSQGEVFGSAYHTVSPADFAEWCVVSGDLDDYPVGTVVQQSSAALQVEPATDYQSVYGVVTDRATFCGSLTGESVPDDLTPEQIEQEYGAKRVAMVGHIQLRVMGPVKIGQRLTVSEIKGVARAAASADEKVFSFAIARTVHELSDDIGVIEVRLL